MIILIATAGHNKTHEAFRQWKGIDFRILPYHRVLAAARLPRATYIFTDMDRLGFWELELSARLYRVLRRKGLRVLNDPALVKHRFALLRALRQQGINDFDVYRVEEGERPRRFPVFLRTQSAHRGALSELLHTEAEVEAAIGRGIARGIPRKELMLVEYCAEPISEGLFRKLAVYRVGSVMVPTLAAHQSSWLAKTGELGIADEAAYVEEYASVSTNRYGEAIRPAFELGEIEYGRADFGMVGGRPQVYEINTNPFLKTVSEHPFAIRVQAARLCMERMEHALKEIDTPNSGGSVAIKDQHLRNQRRLDRWVFGARWTR